VKIALTLVIVISILTACAGILPSQATTPATKPPIPTTIPYMSSMNPNVQEWCEYVRTNFGDVENLIARLNRGAGGHSGFEQSYRDTWALC